MYADLIVVLKRVASSPHVDDECAVFAHLLMCELQTRRNEWIHQEEAKLAAELQSID